MKIQVISFNCILKNKTGRIISTTFNRDVITHSAEPLAQLNILAKKLQNLNKGEKRIIELSAEEAYGLYEPRKVILYPRKKLPNNLTVGETISIADKTGKIRTYKVVQFHDDFVSLDGNHPLAGQDLIFEIEALDVRDATSEEIAESTNVVSQQIYH
jgi:FKBP-type peptidyl-prolyl cis-trans isomerase SlyD